MSNEALSVVEQGENTSVISPISVQDRALLEAWGCEWPSSDEAAWLDEVNQLVARGSVWIKQAGEIGSEARNEVLQAREAFFDRLTALDQATRDELKDHAFWTMPLDTVIRTQRVLFDGGLDVVSIVNANPDVLGYAPEAVGEKLACLTDLGFDAQSVVNAYPTVLNFAPQSVRAKADNLTALGLKATEVISRCPAILTYSPQTVAAKLATLTNHGLNATRAVNQLPQLLNLLAETITSRINDLAERGINATKVVNTNPVVLGFAPASIVEKLDTIASLDIDAVKAVNAAPVLLSVAPETLREKMSGLAGLGLDANKVANSYPVLLSLATESLAEKLQNLTAHGIDAVKATNAFPVILGYASDSLNSKINLLYSVARNWGVEDYRSTVNDIIGEWPVILGYKPDKIRTLARIASDTLPPLAGEAIAIKNVREVVINNLEATLAGYLENKDNIHEPADIRRFGQRYRSLGKAACLQIIAANQDDRAVRAYLRGYTLPDDTTNQ